MLHLLSEEVLKPEDEDSELTKNIQTVVICYMKDKFDAGATDDLLDISSLFDSRFKTFYVKLEKIVALKARVVTEIMKESTSAIGHHSSVSTPGAD